MRAAWPGHPRRPKNASDPVPETSSSTTSRFNYYARLRARPRKARAGPPQGTAVSVAPNSSRPIDGGHACRKSPSTSRQGQSQRGTAVTPTFSQAISTSADIIAHLEKKPAVRPTWSCLITYGLRTAAFLRSRSAAPRPTGFWSRANRIPAIIVSPYAKKGTVDHTQVRHAPRCSG